VFNKSKSNIYNCNLKEKILDLKYDLGSENLTSNDLKDRLNHQYFFKKSAKNTNFNSDNQFNLMINYTKRDILTKGVNLGSQVYFI